MTELDENNNYTYGKLSKFSKGKTSLAQFFLVKAYVYLKNPEIPENIESIKKVYKHLLSTRDECNILKQYFPNFDIPAWVKEFDRFTPYWEQMPEQVHLMSFAAFLYRICTENPELDTHLMSNESIVLGAFNKSFAQLRAKLIADPFTKAIVMRLDKDLQSEDPVRRVQASYTSLQDISDMAKALPDELSNEPLPAESDAPEPEKSKQKGRYRLTNDDIKFRRQKVKRANQIKKDDPQKQWKEIAAELEIPERTLRDWRHNPTYK